MRKSPCLAIGVAVVLSILLASYRADALILDRGVITHDARTGWSWLDLTESTGISFNQMNTMFGPGGAFNAFRHATQAEVFELFENAGIEGFPVQQEVPEAEVDKFLALQELIGVPRMVPGFGFVRNISIGITKDVSQFDSRNILLPFIEVIDFDSAPDKVTKAGGSYPKADSDDTIGHWLIRSGILPGYARSAAIMTETVSEGVFSYSEADGSGLWFQTLIAEGFTYSVTDGTSKFTLVGIGGASNTGSFLISDAMNGDRMLDSDDFLDFPIPVESFTATRIIIPRSGREAGATPRGPAPGFIEATFLQLDSETASFEITPMGEVVDLCTEVDCDDGDPCTTDSCDPSDGSCVYGEAESGIACVADSNPCTDDECDGMGSCVGTPNTNACDDGLFCNGSDTCSGGACSVHAGDPCSGGFECMDVCDEASNMCLTPPETPCTADENACTEDICDGAGVCGHFDAGEPVCGRDAVRICKVRFRATTAGVLADFGFLAQYDRDKGGVLGENCDTLVGGSAYANNNVFQSNVAFGYASDGGEQIGPIDLTECRYVTGTTDPVPGDFMISPAPNERRAGSNDVDVEVSEISCAGCATPALGGAEPFASDCLYVLRATVQLEECEDCVCDTNRDGQILAGDALTCLRRTVDPQVELDCPLCAGEEGGR